jgi:hypothetical protein
MARGRDRHRGIQAERNHLLARVESIAKAPGFGAIRHDLQRETLAVADPIGTQARFGGTKALRCQMAHDEPLCKRAFELSITVRRETGKE